MSALATRDPTQRIAKQLLEIGTSAGEREDDKIVIRRRLTHQMLADMLGLRRETVTIHLRELSQQGVIRRAGRALVLEPDLIAAIVDGSPRTRRGRSRTKVEA